MLNIAYRPIFDVPDVISTGLGETKMGDKIRLIANYKVIEKTKNYTILRITNIYNAPQARKF